MSIHLISIYVLTRHGKAITIGVVPPKDPAYGVQYQLSVDTSTTTGLDIINMVSSRCGVPPVQRKNTETALRYFKNVEPFKSNPEGEEFMQTAQELRNMGLPNIMELGGGTSVWHSSLLADKGVDESGLLFCQTFQYRY